MAVATQMVPRELQRRVDPQVEAGFAVAAADAPVAEVDVGRTRGQLDRERDFAGRERPRRIGTEHVHECRRARGADPRDDQARAERRETKARDVGRERGAPERTPDHRFAQRAVGIGKRTDAHGIALGANLTEVHDVRDVHDESVGLDPGIFEPQEPAGAGAPARAGAMDECDAECFTKVPWPSDALHLHHATGST